MTFKQEIERINLMILEGQLNEAERDLRQLFPLTEAERRQQGHFLGIVLFRRGEISRAKEQLETTAHRHGENVTLLRDLLACHYHLQDMTGFRAGLNRLEGLLRELEPQLCARSLFECSLMVGKFLEEEARLQPALESYNRALQHAMKPSHRLRVLIQKARWHALYEAGEPAGEGDCLSEYYREMISVPREGLTLDLRVELEHSLMLIEMRLIGGDHAWQRVQRIAENLSEADLRLMVFDFVEGALAQDFELDAAVLEKLSYFNELDPYEHFLARVVKGSLEAVGLIQELAVLAPLLPWASYLRLLCLAANLTSNNSIRMELNRKIHLILRALDPKSQQLWKQRLKQAMQNPEIRMEYCSIRRSVAFQGRSVDLSKKKIGMQLLEGLAHKSELSVDEAIQLLWQASFSPEHYHRLRMGVHRLNTLINKATGLGKIIEVDSQAVRLRPEVKIRRADEALI
jgi:hypothetical protein